MRLIRHKSPETLRESIEDLLLANEAENNLFLGLLNRFCEHPNLQEKNHLWFSVEEDGKVLLAGWRTPPYQFGLWAPVGFPDAAADCFIDYIEKHNLEVPGVVARKELADVFAAKVQSRLGLEIYYTMDQGIYRCDKVDEKSLGEGDFQTAKFEELELITDWMIAFHLECMNQELIRSEAREQFRGVIEQGNSYILLADGRPVCTAAASRPMKKGITLNLVYTPPEYRKRGYATTCVGRLTQKLLDDGWTFTSLYTDLTNPTSNSIYQKIGYRWIGRSAEIRFRRKVHF